LVQSHYIDIDTPAIDKTAADECEADKD